MIRAFTETYFRRIYAPAKGKRNKTYGARFQKLRGAGGAKFSEGARFPRAAMFFCKLVISVATLSLVIHISMHILISLI